MVPRWYRKRNKNNIKQKAAYYTLLRSISNKAIYRLKISIKLPSNQKYKKIDKLIKNYKLNTLSNNTKNEYLTSFSVACKHLSLILEMWVLCPSKQALFLSSHIVHKMHNGIVLYICFISFGVTCCCQPSSKTFTFWGITLVESPILLFVFSCELELEVVMDFVTILCIL